ncbi:PREDICTED: UPF0577 protein KIAA1324-like homolog, partial [Chinchilla lanigera]|uniref:UPF0577 protein KIAA1324-like homolog n=1 Tax=Chinchilla lanigera TaxID=34839 RepID=UPI0006981420
RDSLNVRPQLSPSGQSRRPAADSRRLGALAGLAVGQLPLRPGPHATRLPRGGGRGLRGRADGAPRSAGRCAKPLPGRPEGRLRPALLTLPAVETPQERTALLRPRAEKRFGSAAGLLAASCASPCCSAWRPVPGVGGPLRVEVSWPPGPSLLRGVWSARPSAFKDYHFEYTECDSSGSRWRVAIPNSAVDCSGLPDPVRGKECTFSCSSGEYLEMRNQVCSKCAEGSYSLGSGIKFDEWDELPAGFSNVATFMDTVVGPSDSRPGSCSNSSWTPRGNYIESNRDDCTVSLIYAVHLKKSGYIFFEYQYVDNNIFFEFFIQNDQCQEMDSSTDKWVKLTDSGQWGSHSVKLKSGTNILYWR